MPQKRPHRKSRTGCIQCKRKHLKCDETPGQCGGCKRHGIQCVYVVARSRRNTFNNTRDLIARTMENPHANCMTQFVDNLFISDDDSFYLRRSADSGNLNITQIELMHHYSTYTYRTLTSAENQIAGWVHAAPRLGLRNPYLMHAILAVSAAHLAYLRPQHHSEYTSMTSEHTCKAISKYRNCLERGQKPDLATAYYFSGLIAVQGCTGPKHPMSIGISNGEEGEPSWISLMRGIRQVIEELLMDPVKKQKMNPSLLFLDDFTGSTGDCETDQHLSNLLSLYSSDLRPAISSPISPISDGSITKSPTYSVTLENRKIYEETIYLLRGCFHNLHNLPPSDTKSKPIFGFVVWVSKEYLDLLSEKDAIALIILSHFCVLLNQLDSWWMDGWARHMVNSVEALLDPIWIPWIRWPKSIVCK